jgi:hypothetical protein
LLDSLLTLQSEVGGEDVVTIGREELRLLREGSKQAEQLAACNVRLADHLEKLRATSSRVDTLEKENTRLAAELEKSLRKQKNLVGTPRMGTPVAQVARLTPALSDPPSSLNRVDFDDSRPVTKEMYQSLTAKYNLVWDNFIYAKGLKKKAEELYISAEKKNKDWKTYEQSRDFEIEKKADKIQRLEEEVQRLKSQMTGQRERKLDTQDQFPMAHPRLSKASNEVEVAISSPIKGRQPGSLMRNSEPNAVQTGDATRISDSSKDPGQYNNDGADGPEVELPAHRDDIGLRVEDTDFEPIEQHHTSSTEGDPDPLSPNKATGQKNAIKKETSADTAESQDTPIVISSRSIKKRKMHHEPIESGISKVKSERITSSPVGLAGLRYLNPNDSIDLDDIGEKVDTPRKQRRLFDLSREGPRLVSYSPQSGSHRTQNQEISRSTNHFMPERPSQDTPVRRRDSALQPLNTNKQILPRTSEDRAPKKRRIASDKAVGDLMEDGEITPVARSRRQASDSSELLMELLAKPSPPKQVLSPARLGQFRNAGVQQPRSTRQYATSGLANQLRRTSQEESTISKAIQSTYTRGSIPRTSSSKGATRESVDRSRPTSKRSLRGSAEPSRPSSKGTSRSSADLSRPSSKGTSRTSVELPRPSSKRSMRSDFNFEPAQLPKRSNVAEFFEKTRQGRTPRESPQDLRSPSRLSAEVSRPSSRQSASKTTASGSRKAQFCGIANALDRETDPDREPLRNRPVHTLTLQDFKINPNYNQGFNYAFSEVVRGQEARQCLQGCTKPECCGGKFRALAQSMQKPGPPTASQEEADEMLLNEFMGDNAYKIQNMKREQRDELLLQARTRELANKLGKHRHAYERRASPPGFWRTDFPTTQEHLEDRQRAKEKERDVVQQRYEQAMRSGGTYIFRDE